MRAEGQVSRSRVDGGELAQAAESWQVRTLRRLGSELIVRKTVSLLFPWH